MLMDQLKLAMTNIKEKGARSWLTVIGVFVGIAAVVALISLSQGLTQSIEEQFEEAGTDTITVSGGEMRGAGLLDESDIEVLRGIRGVDRANAMLMESGTVKIGDEEETALIYGAEAELYDNFPQYDIEEGRELRDGETNGVLLGNNVESVIFDKEIEVRDNLEIEGEDFTVVGILEETGDPGNDRSIMMDLGRAQELFDQEDKISFMYAMPVDGFDVDEVVEEIEERLEEERDDDDFTVGTLEQILEAVDNVLGMAQALFIGIASISLVVGGVGIMSTMYTSVLEKTKDIGIMKAIGARNESILRIFLFESGLLGLIGGIIGVILGLSLAKGAEIALRAYLDLGIIQVAVPPELIVGALVFSFAVGAISGVFPARRAAKLDPVEALRSE